MFVHINIYLTRVKILIHLKIDENEKKIKISIGHIQNVCVQWQYTSIYKLLKKILIYYKNIASIS